MAGKTWLQPEPPNAGVAYSWVGEANVSESVQTLDGVESRRNYSMNPSFETEVSALSNMGASYAEFGYSFDFTDKISGSRSVVITVKGEGQVSRKSWVRDEGILITETGQTILWAGWIKSSHPLDAYAYPEGITPSGSYRSFRSSWQQGTISIPTEQWTRIEGKFVAKPSDVGSTFQGGGWLSNDTLPVGTVVKTDSWLITVNDDSWTYFDGDSPDERANDVWINTATRTVNRWTKGTGWAATGGETAPTHYLRTHDGWEPQQVTIL